jgi:TonB family protein
MSVAAPAPLSEFPRRHPPARADTSRRVTAGLLTAVLYALFALLAWWSYAPAPPPTVEITATLVREASRNKPAPPLPPILARLIKPRAESSSPPVFTVASSAPTTPAPLPASAVKSSPMPGGTAGNGSMGQAGSGNGNGSGNGQAACLDPVWMLAVTDRVRQFFYYPGVARVQHTTGVVMVHFVVQRDGQLSTVDIGKSSGDWALDTAAQHIMRLAEPLPPIPDRMHTDRVDGLQPINFGVRNFNIKFTIGHCGG